MKSTRATELRQWRAALPRIAATYAIAAIAGYTFAIAGLPLPWMLGPFFVGGVLSAAGLDLKTMPYGRECGQMAVGLIVGLRFTPATLMTMVSLLPAMVAATLYVMAYTMLASFGFQYLARTKPVTAFFSTAAGGVADMAYVAQQKGGDPSSVAMVHALRVSTTVAVVPFLATAFGTEGGGAMAERPDPQSMIWLVAALIPALVGVALVKRSPLPNAWLIGPMLAGILLGVTNILHVGAPEPILLIAQILLGAWLGSQFRREVIGGLPRVALAGVAAALFMICAAFFGSWLLSVATGLSRTTSFLALAPAAMTEMVLTARAMHLDAEIVTAFHVLRILVVCSTILLVFRIFNRARGAHADHNE
ncbi:ammonia monooxygenase [Roseivivax halodurans JCM 10272]|uniref:Ammonia monooxygenase n=1 Tax=Roseivivax halodurans JCM 10272 TaxID=1449350 RepID=X7EB31_9RHOB|nr:AbrB family transcriptional regulator [Roseivivax halodurans]ETX13299.1 ammonia monooxygenase [Roseivivax halodurans JCM 10272]